MPREAQQPRAFTAPISARDGTPGSTTAVPTAVDAMKYPPGTADHPDYMAYYAEVAKQPSQRVGLPTPKYWSRFAGRLPPESVMRRLHGEPSRSRLVGRFDPAVPADLSAAAPSAATAPAATVTVSDAAPDTLVDAERSNAMHLANARLAAKRVTIYAEDEDDADDGDDKEPPTRPVSANSPAAGNSPHRGSGTAVPAAGTNAPTLTIDGAAQRVQRGWRRYLAVRVGHRLLGALHLTSERGLRDVFGTAFIGDPSISVEDQLNEDAAVHLAAVAIEYECRLHSENYARALLRDEPVPAAAASSAAAAQQHQRKSRHLHLLPKRDLAAIVAAGPRDAAGDAERCTSIDLLLGDDPGLAQWLVEHLQRRFWGEKAKDLPPISEIAAARVAAIDGAFVRDVASDWQSVASATRADPPPLLSAAAIRDTHEKRDNADQPGSALAAAFYAKRDPVHNPADDSDVDAGVFTSSDDDDDETAVKSAGFGEARPATASSDRAPSRVETRSIMTNPSPPETPRVASPSAAHVAPASSNNDDDLADEWAFHTEPEIPCGPVAPLPSSSSSPSATASAGGGHQDVWGADFNTAGGFIDIDELRRSGGRAAAVHRPKRTSDTSVAMPAARECVVCELDAVGTVACACGNPVHPDCGTTDAAGRPRCCKACVVHSWGN